MDALRDIWLGWPPAAQDAAILAALLGVPALLGWAICRGYVVRTMLSAMLRRQIVTNVLFVALIGLSVGLGIALIAQERALRQGSARAAEKFDLVVAARGDRVNMMLAAVYLRPSDAPLIGSATLAALQDDPRVDLLAPIAFGDSHDGAPVVGTTPGFVAHLSPSLEEGRAFATTDEAVAGAGSTLAVGDRFTPVHGHGDFVEDVHGAMFTIVGRMRPTGSPWDRAILVAVESVWQVHGLADGHAPGAQERLGPPFDPAYFPGTPAFLVHTDSLGDAYSLQSRYDDDETMAFFPGAVLAELHGLLGDVRQAMSLMAVLTQGLVAAGVLAGLVALSRLFARRFALLRAVGAPPRFVLAVVWTYAVTLIAAGCAIGLVAGWVAAGVVSRLVTARTDIAVTPSLGAPEFQLVAAFLALGSLMALLPALAAYARAPLHDLRQT